MVMIETQDLPRQMMQRANEEIESLRQQLAECEREREELVSNPYKMGICIKCGNPSQDSTKEHFVVATASEGVSPPEDSRPQRVEAPHHFSQPANMVDRIADILVEDHIALMKECEQLRRELALERKRSFREQLATVTKERDELVVRIHEFVNHCNEMERGWYSDGVVGLAVALAKVGADKTGDGS